VRFIEAVVGPHSAKPVPSQNGLIVHLPGPVRVELSSVAEVPLAAALIEALQKRMPLGSSLGGALYPCCELVNGNKVGMLRTDALFFFVC
jgi:hypothetical protein